MLLEELIDTQLKDIKINKNLYYVGKNLGNKRDVIGQGTASIVHKDKSDPHMVKKRSTGERGG